MAELVSIVERAKRRLPASNNSYRVRGWDRVGQSIRRRGGI
jgi:hypothetical protein